MAAPAQRHALVALLLCVTGLASAAPSPSSAPAPTIHVAPVISIIIDDIGDRLRDGQRAVELPWPVSVSFLPHTPFAKRLAERANALNKEVLMHLPMEAQNGKALGPGGLTDAMQRDEFLRTLRDNLAAIPHVRGVNNHMGSLLTRRLQPMHWVMDVLHERPGTYFVDSRTTHHSVALEIARQRGVEATTRDLFLDHFQDADFIHHQFDVLLSKAHAKGAMLAIGHPTALTLGILEQRLPELSARGFQLVPVSRYITTVNRRSEPWQASLSPSPRAAKNLKP
ncbi:MAG TPA: divergent polysaccharide deacetylase family protein [Gammaproteobacteria bacterium]|nr:divergent polysaccharide deacetylase family protein [Gammaproteobacteria bacterium]